VGVDLFGVSNWVRTLQSIPPYWESFRKSLYKEIGDPSKDLENLRRCRRCFMRQDREAVDRVAGCERSARDQAESMRSSTTSRSATVWSSMFVR
jgi:hypothetical protein